MSLKLFRSTGYASILSAGETRVPMHPGWLILFTSVWAGFACNPALWLEVSGLPGGGMRQALTAGAFIASAGGVVLSVLGWRKTLKPAATLVLFLAALAAGSTPPGVPGMPLSSPILLSWAVLGHWQLWATFVGLALLPAVCVCRTRLRRLPGQEQLGVNVKGTMIAGTVMAVSGFALFSGAL